ncbi:MAG: ATP-binding protein [Promethearchaeota archaeon]
MIEEDVYHTLQKHMDKFPVRFPEREGGAEIRLLKRLFTPLEARIATKLKWSPHPSETIDVIYPRLRDTGMSKKELEIMLEKMAKKGLILYEREGKIKYYGNALWVVGIFEFQVNKLSEDLLADITEFYNSPPIREIQSTGIGQLRIIPIEQSIRREESVAHYDDIRKLIKKSKGPFVLINCICRQAKDIEGEPCKATNRRNLCIGIGKFTEAYIEFGWGKEVTREELLEVIRQNEEEGLVLQPSNSQEIEFLCSCCGCCCGSLSGAKSASRPIDFITTNYQAEVNSDLCAGCGTCVQVCQMEAVTLTDETATINLDRCIGCGVCVANCPSDALKLVKKEEEQVPPVTFGDLYAKIEQRRKTLEKNTK